MAQERRTKPNDRFYAPQLVAAILQRLYEDLHARGIPFVVQSIPGHLVRSGPGPKQKLLDVFPYEFFNAEQEGVSVLAAKEFLTPHLGEEQLYWLRSHKHWTPFGHDLMGRVIADHIDKLGLLD